MAKQRHLSKAPITEALVDLRVKLPAESRNVTLIEKIAEQIKKRYPEKKRLLEHRFEFHLGPPPTEKTATNHVGYRFTSDDGQQVVQAGINGFTFSRLKPYDTWEQLREEAYQVWKVYEVVLRPEAITRVATRFINQLDIPGPNIDFDHYLTAAPVVPKTLPQAMSSFFTRTVVPDEKTHVVAIITQAFEPGPNPQIVSVTLDIDVFKEQSFENQDEAWGTIDYLRASKNQIFFDSITEKTAELFE